MKGKKVIAGILLAGILAVTLAGCKNTDNTKEETEKPVITLGSDSYPPYNYLNEDGVPTGIDVELATEAFKRMGYQVEVVQINWEKKKELVESGEIDCIMGCFSMEGRLDDYRWAGPYIASRQVVAVNENSDIYKLSDLEGKNLAVQSTTKPEGIFLNRTDERIPKLGNLISCLLYTSLEDGEIDMVTSARKTPDREEKFDFSRPIGTNNGILTVRSNNSTIVDGNYSTYNGMRVALLNGNTRNEEFADFADNKGFKMCIRDRISAVTQDRMRNIS